VLTASAADPVTFAEAMESPQRVHWTKSLGGRKHIDPAQ
jgi:hypothetical protein